MQKFITGSLVFIATTGLVSLLLTSTAHAQAQSQLPSAGQSPQQSQPQKNVSDEDLQSFAKAYVEVQKIQQSHQASLKNTQDPTQVEKLQQEASVEMSKAVQKQGLTPETYTQILVAVNSDSQLSKKVLDLVNKERAS